MLARPLRELGEGDSRLLLERKALQPLPTKEGRWKRLRLRLRLCLRHVAAHTREFVRHLE